MARPDKQFYWSDTDPSQRVEPSDLKKHNGWNIPNEIPNRQNFNWLFYFIGLWLGYIDQSFSRRYNSFGQAISDFDNLSDYQEFIVSNSGFGPYSSLLIPFSSYLSYSPFNPATSTGGVQKISTNGQYVIAHVTVSAGVAFNKIVCINSDTYNGDFSSVFWTSSMNVLSSDLFCSDGFYVYIFDNTAKRLTVIEISTGDVIVNALDINILGTQIIYDMVCDGKNLIVLSYDSATSDWFVSKYDVSDINAINPVSTSYTSDNGIDHKSICTDGLNIYIAMNGGGASGNIFAISYDSLSLVNGHTIDTNVTKVKTDGQYLYLSTDIGIYRFGVNCAGIIDSKVQLFAHPANDICVDSKNVYFAMKESDPKRGWMFCFQKNDTVVSGAYFWNSNSYSLNDPVKCVCSDGQRIYIGGWTQNGITALALVGLNAPDNTFFGKKLPRGLQGQPFEGLPYSMT